MDLNALIAKLQEPAEEKEAWRHGVDAALNGANVDNSHFSIFQTPEATEAWAAGNKQARAFLDAAAGPEVSDGCDSEGFAGGCVRAGHTPETCPNRPPPEDLSVAGKCIACGGVVMFLPHQLPAKCPCGGTFLARVGRYRKPPDTREEADALARLKLELAENIAALQRLHILVLRNCGHVTSSELFEVTRHLTRYHNLPEDVREAVNRIRKERWNIE